MKIITALVTPILNDKSLDFNSLDKLINIQINAKIDAILIAGSTGEKFGLSSDNFFNLCKYTVDKFKNNIKIICNVGTFNTQESIANAKKCEAIGVDSILLVNPYYIKITQEGLYNHFKAIANSVDIPVYLYNIPGRTGVNLEVETLKKLIEIENIKGIKDSTGNFSQLIEIFKINKKNFEIFCGDDNLIYPFLSLGGDGIISVITNIFPKEVKLLVDYLSTDISVENLKLAKEIFFIIFSLTEALCKIGNNPIAVKTILAEEKIILENFFEPLHPLNIADKEKLLNIFNSTKKSLLSFLQKS